MHVATNIRSVTLTGSFAHVLRFSTEEALGVAEGHHDPQDASIQ